MTVLGLDLVPPYQVTAHWEKFMAALGPGKEAKKAQADFVRSAVKDVRYGPDSLREFTQWRVRTHPIVLGSVPWRSLAMSAGGLWGAGEVRKGSPVSCRGSQRHSSF